MLPIEPRPARWGMTRLSSRPGVEALAIFQGTQGYVTPAWYRSEEESGKVVPTWNYAVAHAYGPLRVIEDPAWVRRLVERLTQAHERERPQPWHVTDAPEHYIDRQLKGILGLEILLTRLEGKWKMSQNRSPENRSGVVAGRRRRGDAASLALADLVAGTTDTAAPPAFEGGRPASSP